MARTGRNIGSQGPRRTGGVRRQGRIRAFLANLRVPGMRHSAYRGAHPSRPNLKRVPALTASDRNPNRNRGRYGLGRAERRPEPEPRSIPWRRIGVTTLSVAVLGAVAYGSAWLLTSDTLRVTQIDVTGAQVTDASAIAASAGLGGDSMLTADLDAAVASIQALPSVRSATVERAWPDQVRIAVVEHQAWGFWQSGATVYVIDRDGQVLQAARPAPVGAPTILEVATPAEIEASREDGVVADPDTVHLVARLLDQDVFRRLDVHPAAFVFDRARGLTVTLQDGPDALFGDSSNYAFKVDALGQIVAQLEARAGAPLQVSEVDLRFGRNVVLR